MQTHGPKRVYTPRSVEFWFEKLSDEWEGAFSTRQLDEGARIYRQGEVRELELTDKDAIVHRRVEKRDEYAVIEWGRDGLSVRSSSTDLDVARALAVAGLHEIEELVADEVSPLPGTASGDTSSSVNPEYADTAGGATAEVSSPTPSPAPLSHVANGNGGIGTGLARSGTGTSSATRSHAISPPRTGGVVNGGPSRPLVLAFQTKVEGLVFQAFWKNSGGSRSPAHGAAAHAPGHAHVTSTERAKLIGLAAYARKAHFTYHAESGIYTLASVVEIPNFLKVTLPAWKRLFSVELDDAAARLLKGPLSIEIEAVAERKGAKSDPSGVLDLRWIFRAGERFLTDEEVAVVTRSGSNPMILPSLGIVSLPVEKLASVNAWRKNVADTHADGVLSPYLIFSLFNDSKMKLTLSPELETWRQKVLSPVSESISLPTWLRPYQRRGVEWMRHLGDTGCHGLLADEMGLGKTVQVLSLLSLQGIGQRSHLIVCPASVVPVWREEIAKFFPHLPVDVLKTGNDFAAKKDPVIWLASYTQLRKHRALLDTAEFGYAILDEGQFIKNPDAKVTQTCFAIRSTHRVVLTGTPLENRQLDLWSIFRFL
ncbi:MAG TPA: SNF2-related protein, partial [Opitutaceae bacterium]|nr:SNF2-related protein [Opitutaceae bacterium]